jgi:hypothetical protein
MNSSLVLNCIMCDSEFNLDDRSPYVLPCESHTSCKHCLKQAKSLMLKQVKCPVDNTILKLDDLPSLSKDSNVIKYLRNK